MSLISLFVMIFLIGSKLLPPTFSDKLIEWVELKIYIARNMASNNSTEADNTNNSNPVLTKDSDNLMASSDPKIAPIEPPAIMNP